MPLPALVHYPTSREYRTHYERIYCRGIITTFDGIRVYFSPEMFGHIFFESTLRNGDKDVFSTIRAQRIDWIKATLEHHRATFYQGWIKTRRRYDASRRVAVVYEDFVVVIAMKLSREGELRANFVTCYQADNSIQKIRSSPAWTRAACLTALGAIP
jgi:hypothetical protein